MLPLTETQIESQMCIRDRVKVRQAVLDACKKNKVMFLNAGSSDQNSPDYVVKQIRCV